MAVAGHIDVRVPVVVVIADRYAEEHRSIGVNLALRGHISERTVVIVTIKRGLRRLIRVKKWRVAAVYEKCVEIAVLVVVNPGDARTHCFRIKPRGRSGALVVEMNSCFVRDVAKLYSVRIRDFAAMPQLDRVVWLLLFRRAFRLRCRVMLPRLHSCDAKNR